MIVLNPRTKRNEESPPAFTFFAKKTRCETDYLRRCVLEARALFYKKASVGTGKKMSQHQPPVPYPNP
jgi:hypothetical protein